MSNKRDFGGIAQRLGKPGWAGVALLVFAFAMYIVNFREIVLGTAVIGGVLIWLGWRRPAPRGERTTPQRTLRRRFAPDMPGWGLAGWAMLVVVLAIASVAYIDREMNRNLGDPETTGFLNPLGGVLAAAGFLMGLAGLAVSSLRSRDKHDETERRAE